MTFIRSFTGFTPPARYDNVSFTIALIGEANSNVGPFQQIDAITIAADTNPANPASHNLTTGNAQLEYGAWYQITWQDPNGGTAVANALNGPLAPLASDPARNWTGRLLENVPRLQRQAFRGDGQKAVFLLRSTPVASFPLAVTVSGTPLQAWTDYAPNPNAPRELMFTTAPPLGASVTVQWFNLLWSDYELAEYVSQARLDYFDDRGVVYQAALYALDTVLMGAATALNFGSGQETFDVASIFQRLETLRQVWQTHLVERQDTGAAITVQEVYGDNIAAADYVEDVQSIDPLNWNSWTG